jgi:hypothetical protein
VAPVIVPLAGRPCRVWNWTTARRVCAPKLPSIEIL